MKTIYTFLLMMSLSMMALAVPADRTPRRVRMSDGTEVLAILYGDEHFSWYETLDGNILRETEEGYVLSDERPLDIRVKAQKVRCKKVQKIGKQDSAPLPALGSPRIPVILVSFQDSVFQVKPTDEELVEFYDLYCNGTRDGNLYKDHGSYGAIRDYFENQSREVFTPEFEVIGHVRLDRPESDYGQNTSSRDGSDKDFIGFCRDAVTKAMELRPDVDWMQFSNRGKNRVDMVLFIYAGCGEHDGVASSTLWPKWQSLNFSVNGITIHSGLCSSENMPIKSDGVIMGVKPEGIGVLCHEMNHALGLPDFYDTNYKAFGMDIWSIMDYGQYAGSSYIPVAMTAYEREFMGWETMEELTTSGWVTLEPTATTGKGYKIVNPENPNEYYIVENRQRVSWDSGVGRYGHGLMVTHVDYDASKWSSNSVNVDINHQRMTIIAANNLYYGTCVAKSDEGAKLIETWSGNCYPFENNDSLTANSVPAATVFTTSGFMHKDLNRIRENADKTVSFYFGNDFVDAVEALEQRSTRRLPVIYDLSGRRIANPPKSGLYIINGSKVIIR